GLVRLLHRHHWDFMGIRYYWFTATIILTIAGAGLFFWRLNPDKYGRSVMDIDFTGGTAYTGKLAQPMTMEELRDKLEKNGPVPGMTLQESELPGISIEQEYALGDPPGRSSRVTVRTAEMDPRKVQKIVNTRLGEALAYIELHKFTLSTDGKSATLEFTQPKSSTLAFASPAQVERLLSEEKTSLLPQDRQLRFHLEALGEPDNRGGYAQMKVSPTET